MLLIYKTMEKYPEIKKQADKFCEELIIRNKKVEEYLKDEKNATSKEEAQKIRKKWREEKELFYEKWHNTKLYKKYSTIYCQILSDVKF